MASSKLKMDKIIRKIKMAGIVEGIDKKWLRIATNVNIRMLN